MANYEPDDEWKVQLKSRIEDGLQSMVADAKENHEAELRKASDDPETRTRLEVDYKQAMQTIKSLATEQYQLELDRERNQRRWTAGVPMTPAWTQYFREEQQNIMNSIKQTSNQTDNSVRTVTESPTEEPRSATSKPSSTPPRTRLSSIDRPSQPSPVSSDRWDSSLGRSSGSIPSAEPHLARSPPKPLPEVWKPTISSTDDVLPPKTYNLGRRGSTASMKSSGSGASIRPSITETIPEGVDDGPGESAIEEDDYERAQETTEQGRISADKSPEKDRRPHFRRNSRQSHADVGFRSDELLGSTGLNLRSASSSTMQYATSPPPNRLLSAKPSLTFNDRHHSIDAPGKPPPYREYTFSSRDNPLHRNQQVPFQDPPSARPISAKPSYGGDDRDYGPPNSTVHRPHGPRSYFSQRESRPISRQTSFIRQPYIEVDDDDDERDIDRGPDRFWDGEYDRDRDRDGRRSEPRRATTYPYSAPHHSPDGSRLMSQDYVHMNDLYDDRSEGVSGPSHGRYHYRGLPPEDSEYQRPPDGTRPPTRRPSYVIPREDPDRRFSSENGSSLFNSSRKARLANRQILLDGHSHHYPSAGGIPIPRRTPGLEESPVYPAWRDLSVRPNYEYHQHVRSPPNLESPSHHRFAQCPPSYHNSPHDDHPSFGGREMDSSNRGSVTDEYDSDEDTDEDEDDDGIGVEDRRLRDLEARKQKLEESRRQADDELKRTELKIQQLAEEEARKKRKDKEEQDEADRKAEEARRREEDARKKEEEIRRMEEEVKKKEEDAAKKAEEARKMEEQAKKLEEEAQRKERDARKKEAAAKMKEDEARRKAEDLSRKEEETRQRAVQLEQDTEKTKQMQFEAQKIAEDLKKMEEEAHKKDMEIREREDILRRREEELMRREADNFRREQEARKREEEARKREESRKEEASKEAARKEEARKEEARKEEARKEEARQEEARKEAEARQEEVRLEQVRKEEAKKKEPKQLEARRDKETKKKVAEGKREEEKAKRKLQAEAARRIEEDARREEDILEESQHLDDDIFYDLESKLADPKLMDEQLKLLQEAEFRKREEDIRRIRQERKRNDSVGNDSAWSTSSYPSASPGMSPGMSRTSQFNGPPVSERSAGPSSGWGSSIKPATASPAVNRASANASTGKPRTDSASSGTYPLSSSPHTASFSEAERTRKQQEFAGSQQEQFRRTQEKLEAERQLKSAGRLLSREELQRVFEHHERLWSRLNTLQELSWNDFPWPMVKQPSNPDDMSLSLISAYIQSPVHSDKDKSRTPKDRIKEHIKRWHPDRFETKLLPKVSEGEREKVRHGAGNVARYLSDLLRKENEGSISIFGD